MPKTGMLFAFSLIFAATRTVAKEPNPAEVLLRDIANLATTSTSWRIEGSERFVNKSEDHTYTFTLLRQPGKMRFDQSGEPRSAVIVCAGSETLLYSPRLKRYRKESAVTSKACSLILSGWAELPIVVKSPTVKGKCAADPSIKSGTYTLIRGQSEPRILGAGRAQRDFCVDPVQKRILWETAKDKDGTRTFVYSRVDRDVAVADESFRYEPPADSKETHYGLPVPEGGMGFIEGTKEPRLLSSKPMKYPPALQGQDVEGTTVLYVTIDEKSSITELLVFESSRREFDEEALRGVREWQFSSATRNGQPVPAAVLVQVNFHPH
jgi:TonB family protein